MAKADSAMAALGGQAPDFHLPDVVSGRTISLQTFTAQAALLVMFICRHCPYVQHVEKEFPRLGRDYGGRNVGIIAISANDAKAYPEDAPDKLKAQANDLGFTFPYCYDESQGIAKAYGAACTPDFFLFDGARRLVYRGQFDDSRPGNGKPVTGRDLRAALDAVLDARHVDPQQRPSVGCSIKWKHA